MDFFESLKQLKERIIHPELTVNEEPIDHTETIPEPEESITMEQWLATHDLSTPPAEKKVASPTITNSVFQEKLKQAIQKPKPAPKSASKQPTGNSVVEQSPPEPTPQPTPLPDDAAFDWSEEFSDLNKTIDPAVWFSESESPVEEPAIATDSAPTTFEELPFSESDGTEILNYLDQTGIMLKSADFEKKRARGEEGVYRSKGAVEKTIDLHGMAVRDAELKLIRTFDDAKVRGYQQLLIVHGRGNHSRGGDAKMKRMVIDLLEGSLADRVSSFTFAPFNEGGGGATRVILK